MTPALLVWPEAKADIREAREWYENNRVELGREFLAAVREILGTVENSPLRFPRVKGEVRRFHARRDPKVWQARLISRR